MRYVVLSLMFWSLAAPACEVEFAPRELPFDDEAELFAYVRDTVRPLSVKQDTEYVGLIFRRSAGLFMRVGKGCAHHDSFRLWLKPDRDLVGIWHTHGRPGFYRDTFSPEDAGLVQQAGVPLYLISPSGVLRVLSPADADRAPQLLRRRGSITTVRGYSGKLLTLATSR